MNDDLYFMSEAIAEARLAAEIDEVPVGAVIVCDGEIIARAHNLRETAKNALCHAETMAVDAACKALGGWRLPRCTLYVTLEPCPMCAGAIVNSRIERVVFGAYDRRAGAFGSVIDLNAYPLNHKPEIVGGVMEEECVALLQTFFKKKREQEKLQKNNL